jgi:hypothetical protein
VQGWTVKFLLPSPLYYIYPPLRPNVTAEWAALLRSEGLLSNLGLATGYRDRLFLSPSHPVIPPDHNGSSHILSSSPDGILTVAAIAYGVKYEYTNNT